MPPPVKELNSSTNDLSEPKKEEVVYLNDLIEDDIYYPQSDGKPMADSTLQYKYIARLKSGFDCLYRDRDDVFVAADLLVYPVQGNNDLSFAPDLLIALGRPKGHRRSYQQWKENNHPPDVAFEIRSHSNTQAEMDEKREKYELYGFKEYYDYDPNKGTLEGWSRDPASGKFRQIKNMHKWTSPLTGVTLHLDEADLVVTRPDGKIFLDSEETEKEIIALTTRAEEEAKRAREADKRAQKEAKRAQEEAKRAREADQRAEKEAKRAREADKRAEEEATRAEEAALINQKLIEKLRDAGIDPEL